jgi:hypothetical protein
MLGSQTQLPGLPVASPAGAATSASAPDQGKPFRSGLGLSLMAELTFSRNWTVRLGASLDPALRADSDVEPLVGGAKSSGLSGGFGYKMFGGELNLGYQYRQSQDVDTANLEGNWSKAGYVPTPASTSRVEGMGHLWSVGYKRSF